MIFFFSSHDIIYPFSDIPTEIKEDLTDVPIEDIHCIISSILFFKKNYQSFFSFQKRLYKYHSIEINLYFFKNIPVIQKKLNYISNEYFLSLYGINSLRKYIPTFSYTFFQKEKKELWMEYQEGKTLFDYLNEYKKKENIDREEEGYNYLSIFLQILCSLEVAQEKLLFIHYDFHLENIIINKDIKPISFPIYNNHYKFTDKKYTISIIDFEHSSIRYKDKIINSIQTHLFPYGYLSIFYSSVDLLRFLLSFQYNFFEYSLQKSHFLYSIFQFHEFILENFYGFSFLKNQEEIKHALNYHSTIFFNCISTRRIYKTPYELLLFLKKEEITIYHFFSIDTFPISIEPYPNKFINFFIPKQIYSLSYFIQFITYFNNFYTISYSIEKIKEQYNSLYIYQSSFEYFRNQNHIPPSLYKKSLKIYRYFHSIEQLILLYKHYNKLPPLSIKYHKLNYFNKN